MVGLVTPPMGLSMFIICEISQITTSQFMRGMGWFFLALIAVMATMLLIPETVTWLPQVLIG
jgi:C4-dicarboxylate transporter DctM subunit